MKKNIVTLIVMAVIMIGGFIADFESKQWAQRELRGKAPIVAVSGLLDFGFAENRGMVFGILNNKMPDLSRIILTVIRILILIGLTIFIVYNLKHGWWYLLPFFMFWAGAIGNLVDPFIYGYVVDFIHMQLWHLFNWPFFFNLADAYVTIGIVLMVVNGSFSKKNVPVAQSSNSQPEQV